MNDRNTPFCLFGLPQYGARATWEVTNVCNYLCKHCCTSSLAAKSPDELNLGEFRRALDDMASFGVTEIYFSGGEPFARPDMLQIIEHAKSHNIQLCIATNGSLIRPAIAQRLRALQVEKMHVSLDDYRAPMFNFFRGGEYFDEVVRGIRILKSNDLYTRIGCVIWAQNVEHLEDMVQFCVGLGVDQLALNWLVRVGRFVQNPQVAVPQAEFGKTLAEVNRLREKYKGQIKISMLRSSQFGHTDSSCPAGTLLFHIDHKGRLSTCSWIYKMDQRFTSEQTLKTHSFLELVKDKRIAEWLTMVIERTEKFGPGCPAVCYQTDSNYMALDPLYSPVDEIITPSI